MARQPDLRDVLAATREQAQGLGNQVGRRAVLRVMRAADADLAKRLLQRQGLKGRGDATFTSAQMELTLAQVRDVTRQTMADLGGAVAGQAVDAAEAATEGQLAYMRAAERRFRGINQVLPLDDAMMLDAATRAQRLRGACARQMCVRVRRTVLQKRAARRRPAVIVASYAADTLTSTPLRRRARGRSPSVVVPTWACPRSRSSAAARPTDQSQQHAGR